VVKKDVNDRVKVGKFRLLYIKFLRFFKITLITLVVSLVFFFISILFESNLVERFFQNISDFYSNLAYRNICTNIEIIGVNRASIIEIQDKIRVFCDQENKNNLRVLLTSIKSNPWIRDVTVRRKIPNMLQITINEYIPFAIWKDKNATKLIDEYGDVILVSDKEKSSYRNLLIIGGDTTIKSIRSLFNLLSSNPHLFSKVKTATHVGKRRWNLELENGILVKMPENNTTEMWNKLDKIISIRGIDVSIKTIDLRDVDKIFLEQNKIR